MSWLLDFGKDLLGGAATAAFGAGSQFLSSKQQLANQKALNQQSFDMQKQLNAQQQEYARQNADVQYQRQRQLSQDSWLLNKNGMLAAGINPAFSEGAGNATSNVDAAAAPSAGAAPSSSAPFVDYLGSVQLGVDTLLKKAQIDNLNANTSKTQTDSERARFEFDNFRDNQIEYLNKMLANDWRQSLYRTEVGKEQATTQLKESEFWNSDNGKRVEEKLQSELNSLSTSAKQIQFDYEKAKQFKPKEFEKLAAEVEQIRSNTNLLKSKDENQKIINGFNRLGIGISSDFIGSIAALLSSGHGKELADKAVDTVVGFLGGLITQAKNAITGD